MAREFLKEYLDQFFDEVDPKDFYRSIFPLGELEEKGKQETGKYNAIAVELLPKPEEPTEEGQDRNARRHIVTDDLEMLDQLLESENFIIISPISYIGRSRHAKNARFIYAMAIDLDGIDTKERLTDLFYQIDNEIIPKPTFIVWSGSGLHLYYKFSQPIPCFHNVTKQLSELKKGLTKRIWNSYVTSLSDKPQVQSLFQGFRMVGGVTKEGLRTTAYDIGKEIDLEYLNYFVDDRYKVKDIVYKSTLPLSEAKKKYPEWYEKRIVEKKPRGTWTCKRDLYDWWKKKIYLEITEGHRYYGLMCLSIYAKKCGIGRDELEQDAFGMIADMEKLTVNEDNHFTREDVLAALEIFNDSYITFPIHSIVDLTNIPIEKNKRNGRKQADHIKLMNFVREELNGNKNWRANPSQKETVEAWIATHSDLELSKSELIKLCCQETKLSRSTVYRHWLDN